MKKVQEQREARRQDIDDRLGAAIGERNLQMQGTKAYNELAKIIKAIREEYKNNVKTRIVVQYYQGHYYGVDTANPRLTMAD